MKKMSRSLIAVVQMTSTHDKEANFRTAKDLIQRASQNNAKMAFLPECFDYIGRTKEESLGMAEAVDAKSGLVSQYRSLAKELGIWLSLGGFHEKDPSGSGKLYNSHLLIASDGTLITRYHKTHLFDIDIPERLRLKESDYTLPGPAFVQPVETPCYDLRFPQMSEWLRANGAQILTFPSAFTMNTGLAHWESLLRARAIETQTYVVAAAQAGKHNEKRMSYGHSLVVDPWGAIIAQCSEGTSVSFAEIDLAYLTKVRQQLPCFDHQRSDLYQRVSSADAELIPTTAMNAQQSSSISLQQRVSSESTTSDVLICPLREVQKFTNLAPDEVSDLYLTVQKIQRKLEGHYGADSSTISIQDGPAAGQTIPHVHVHLLPRKKGDFLDNDQIYGELAKPVDASDDPKAWRTAEVMAAEARMFRDLLNM